MAQKNYNLTFMVNIARYEHEGNEYDALNIDVVYRKAKGFMVIYQPVKRTDSGYMTGPMPSSDPLVTATEVFIKWAPRTSLKALEQIKQNIEAAEECITWLFDKREWKKLAAAIRNIATEGYTANFKQQFEEFKSNPHATTKEDNLSPMMRQFYDMKEKHPEAILLFRCGDFYEIYEQDAKDAAKILGITLTRRHNGNSQAATEMAGFPHHALDTYLPRLIRAGRRVAICDQLEDPKLTKKLVKRGITEMLTPMQMQNETDNKTTTKNTKTMAAKKTKAKDSEAGKKTTIVEDEVTEVQDIVPTVTKPKPDAAVTVPLSNHGTLVIAGVPRPSEKKVKPAPVQEVSTLPNVELVTYTTKKGEQAPRIIGFSGKDDPRWKKHYEAAIAAAKAYKDAKKKDPKAKPTSNPFGPYCTRNIDQSYTCVLNFGTRYMDVARQLVKAYNTSDRQSWQRAEDAVMACKSGISAEWQQRKAERKAERTAAKATEANKSTEKTYTLDDMAQLLKQKFSELKDVNPEDIKKLLAA